MQKKILDWNQYLDKAAETVAEGVVLLENSNNLLPLKPAQKVAIFGRAQMNYYKSGTGSGGMVNVSKVTGIVEGLTKAGVPICESLHQTYANWVESHPFDLGEGWGEEPWCQEEMPLTKEILQNSAAETDTAIVIIGRTAGEEMDNSDRPGSMRLSIAEENMLYQVCQNFSKVILLLNVGNIMDMSFMRDSRFHIDALLYVWHGGMVGGIGTAAVLTGKANPSGRLPDTIAERVADYPAAKNFGDDERNFYQEDIFVGYRYFETFPEAQGKVMYPFGYGLSYTTFDYSDIKYDKERNIVSLTVENTGAYAGKDVVQLYLNKGTTHLAQPTLELCGFQKTPLLQPQEKCTVEIPFLLEDFPSYDDSGVTGHKGCFVLDSGIYVLFVGKDVRTLYAIHHITVPNVLVVQETNPTPGPTLPYQRMTIDPQTKKQIWEETPLTAPDEDQQRLDNLPQEIPYTGNRGIRLEDVKNQKATMEDFIAQLSDYDLSCIVRGEGMGSPKVTAGTASAFGGVTDELHDTYGIPCGCCSDGPSGIRMDCGTKAFSLPIGVLLASTFNPDIVSELYSMLGLELAANRIDALLGPGMNIHRHPLNGRNFEYFSEDPFLTGKMATAVVQGLQSAGVTGTLKHFCANNQEWHRHVSDAVVSERALREIYLRGFEMAVKNGANSVMTTYGSLNGLWTAGNYPLVTSVLHNDWNFKGIVMTDWWAGMNHRNQPQDLNDFATMVRAQNDLYMVCSDSAKHDDTTLAELESGALTRAELQRCASNICGFLMHTYAMDRLCGGENPVEIINRPAEDTDTMVENVAVYEVDKEFNLPMDGYSPKKGENLVFILNMNYPAVYEVTITASSDMSETAQMPLTVFVTGIPSGTYTWNGTGGKPVEITRDVALYSHFSTIRIYFAQSGLTIHNIHFKHTDKKASLLLS